MIVVLGIHSSIIYRNLFVHCLADMSASSESNKFQSVSSSINHVTCSREICIVVQPYTSGFWNITMCIYVFPILGLEKPQDDQRWTVEGQLCKCLISDISVA